MSGWNYRVMYRECNGERLYEIHEAYYDEAGNVTAWSADPIAPGGNTQDELFLDLHHMLRARAKPTLSLTQLESDAAARSKEGA